MAHVFLSYARTDKPRVRWLQESLRDLGYSVFWDGEIEVGAAWETRLIGEIERADVVVVAWTEASILSAWVLREVSEARARDIAVAPARLDGVEPPAEHGDLNYADLKDWLGDADHPEWRKLAHAVATAADAARAGRPIRDPVASVAVRMRTASAATANQADDHGFRRIRARDADDFARHDAALRRAGYALLERTKHRAEYVRQRRMDCWLSALLLLLGVLPFFIYRRIVRRQPELDRVRLLLPAREL